jgi:LmbE family N-acetylglucosaminyl deacetylase
LSIGNAFRAAVRLIYRRLLPKGAKNSLRAWTMFDVPDSPPEVIDSFDESRVMVLAPHMDDEVVGCGGTLRRHAQAGARITVVFLTDGSSSDPQLALGRGGSDAKIQVARAELCAQRKQEAGEAARILGYDDLVFLDRPDGSLEVDDALICEVADLIAQREPQIIYYPCMLELHPDHWQASRLLAKLVDNGSCPALANIRCRGYEAWTPLLPNRLVDISDVFDVKLEALRVFSSQLQHVDYLRTTTGLNTYRSVTRDGKGYWEAYFESSAAQHAELVRQLELAR